MNGHKNWNHWNVHLWITNDEGLYRAAREAVEMAHNKDRAASAYMRWLKSLNIHETPDGAPYTQTSVRAAMRDL